jgi:hypothetical protein
MIKTSSERKLFTMKATEKNNVKNIKIIIKIVILLFCAKFLWHCGLYDPCVLYFFVIGKLSRTIFSESEI